MAHAARALLRKPGVPSLETKELLRSLLSDVLDDLGIELVLPGQAQAPADLTLALIQPGEDVGRVVESARAAGGAPLLLILPFADEALRQRALISGVKGVYTLGEPLEHLERQMLELSGGAGGRPGAPAGNRRALLMESPAASAPPPATPEPLLLDAHGIRLTPSRLEALGRIYPLLEVHSARAQREAPKLLAPVAVGLGIAIAMPVALSLVHALGADVSTYLELALLLAGLVVFFSLARLMMAQDTWWLLLETSSGTTRAYQSSDSDFIQLLVGMVLRAMASPAHRPEPAGLPAAPAHPKSGGA